MGKIILSEPLRVAKDDFIILIKELAVTLTDDTRTNDKKENETILTLKQGQR